MSITYTTHELQTLARENYIGVYVGTLASLVFQGYVMSLMFSYIQIPRSISPLAEKALLVIIFTLTLFLSCIDMQQVFSIGVTHFTDTAYIFRIKWTGGVGVLGTGMVHAVGQTFFGVRLIKLAGLNRAFTVPLFLFIAGGLAPSIGTGIRLLGQDRTNLQEFRSELAPWVYARYAMATGIDLSLTLGSVWALRRKNEGVSTRAVTMWEQAAFYAVHAMVLPTLACALALILRIALPRSTIHEFPMHCLSKISLLVLLQMLLSRDQTRPDMRPDLSCQGKSADQGVSRSFPSSGSAGSYPSGDRTAGRINSSEKRLNLVHDPQSPTDGDHDGDEDDLYKPASRTDLDSVEAGRYHQHGLNYKNDEFVDIARPGEVHKF